MATIQKSNWIDSAEGVRLQKSTKAFLNLLKLMTSVLTVGLMTCFIHCDAACYNFTSENSVLQQQLYMKHNMRERHPPSLTRRHCWINGALPTHFNTNTSVYCQSDLWVLAGHVGCKAWLFLRTRGGWNTNFVPYYFILTLYIFYCVLLFFIHRTWSATSGLIHIIFFIMPMYTWLWMMLD